MVGKAAGGGVGFPRKYEGMDGKRWNRSYGRYAIEYGKERSGLKTGMRD